MELDHIFIRSELYGPEADALLLSLVEGTPNRHVGQGTANRRFFFHNAYLEFIWICDANEARNETTWPTQLYERLVSGSSASPFGFCFRPSGEEKAPPFASWSYRPDYLPDDFHIAMARDNPLNEPLWFFLDFARRPDSVPEDQREPLHHRSFWKEITSVTLTTRGEVTSEAARRVSQLPSFEIKSGHVDHLEITFDDGSLGRQSDLRSRGLPLSFRE